MIPESQDASAIFDALKALNSTLLDINIALENINSNILRMVDWETR